MKDLGVTDCSNLSWSKNIKSISAKANSLSGMIRRSISFDAPSPVKFQLYVSHVCSILEYCSYLWSPANAILLLERVQSHATKYILNNYSDMSYAERCIQLSILPLCFRREIIDLMLFYKYLHNYVDCDFSSYFELVGSLHSLPRHVCDASSVFSFEKHVNDLYFSLLRNFNINERCTWSLVCTCGFCRS